MENNASTVQKIPFYHVITNGFVFHIATLLKTEKMTEKSFRKKINFIIRLKFAQHKLFCISVNVYKIHEGDEFEEFFEVLSKFQKKKLKFQTKFVEKHLKNG